MAGVLAPEYGARFGHYPLYKRVAHPGHHRGPPVFTYDLRDRLGTNEVVQDDLTRVLLQHRLGHDGCRGRPAHWFGLVVDQEAPVRVPVKSQAHVGSLFQDSCSQISQVGRLDGVGRVVGEIAIQLAVHNFEIEGQALEDGGDHETAHAVGRVGHHAQRLQSVTVDETTDLFRVGSQHITVADRPPLILGHLAQVTRLHRRADFPSPDSMPTGRAPARHSLMPL